MQMQLFSRIYWKGTSANAGPHYQKLYARVTHIWGNRRGQPSPSAMKGPHPERTASMITFFVWKIATAIFIDSSIIIITG